jgi:type I restriction enzyme, S subunit
MIEWCETELGDIADVKGGKRLPNGSALTETPTNHPYIRTRDINGNKIAIKELLFVPDEAFLAISNYIVEKGDVIISIVGTIGLCAVIPDELHLASLTENCAKIVNINSNSLSKAFLFYYLVSPDGQAEIRARNVGSTQPKLPLYNIKSLPIPLPPLEEQEAITAVLSSLDDKIDLLHRQNQTLEATAEALFRHWFIEQAQPDWEEGTLGDLVVFNYGKTLKEGDRTGSGYQVLGSNGVIGFHQEFLVKAPGIVTGRKGTLGVITYLFDDFYPIDTTFYITSKTKSSNLLYEYFLLKSVRLGEMNSDSAVPGLNRNAAHGVPVIIPPQKLVREFNNYCNSLFTKMNKNQQQIHTLEALRDTLLPQLMRGGIRLRP